MGHEFLLDQIANTDDASREQRWLELPDRLASAGVTLPVPGSEVWYLQAFHATFTADANVASRSVVLRATQGTFRYWEIPGMQSMVANITHHLSWLGNMSTHYIETNIVRHVLPWPGIPIPGGRTIELAVSGAQAGDTLTGLTAVVEVAYTYQGRERGLMQARRDAELFSGLTEGP